MTNEPQPISSDATIAAKLEALLFQHGEPIAIERAAKLVGADPEACAVAIDAIERAMNEDSARGLTVLRHGSGVQLVTKQSCREIGQTLLEDEFRAELSPAGLEVLSLVAYLGPAPRATVDYIRGVNSSFTIRNLVVRGLVERDPDTSHGNTYSYRATAAFLRHLGIARIEELPDYAAYRAKLSGMMRDEEKPAAPADERSSIADSA